MTRRNHRARYARRAAFSTAATSPLQGQQPYDAASAWAAKLPPDFDPEKWAQMRREEAINSVASSLNSPQFNPQVMLSDDDWAARFKLPVSFGAPTEERERLDREFASVFDHAGGLGAFRSTLADHAASEGQSAMSFFMGYGALQNIAQNGMIRACVQTVTDDITKKWIEIVGGEEEDNERVAKLDDLQRSYKLQALFHDAIEKVGYFGGAAIFIDTGATDEELELPLAFNNKSAELRPGAPLRFVVLDPVNLSPGEYNADNPLRSDYMRPASWWVLGHKVHRDRLIILYDNEPPVLLKPAYNFLGIPRAQILWDYILHWNQARIYTNDLLKKISLLVVKTDTDQIFCTPGGVQTYDIKIKALQRYRDNNSIYVCDKESEDVSNVQTSIAGATDVVRQSLEMVAAINRTPAVKLLGISPSGFNATGESDITNYYDHIMSQQELYRPAIAKCLKAMQLVHFGDIDKTVDFRFVELAKENESTRAMNANTKMQMLSTALQNQVISADEMRQAIKDDADMGLDFLTGDAPDEQPQDMGDADQDFAALLGGGASSGAGAIAGAATGSSVQKPPLDDLSKYTLTPDGTEAETVEKEGNDS